MIARATTAETALRPPRDPAACLSQSAGAFALRSWPATGGNNIRTADDHIINNLRGFGS